MKNETLAPTAERTLRLIELLLTEPEGLTPQDLLLHLDISRSSLFLLLKTLKALGYVEQTEKRGRYRLGPRLQAWQNASSPISQDLLASFYQESSRETWQDTLVLTLLSEEGPFVLAQIEGHELIRTVFTVGQVYPEFRAATKILSASPTPDIQKSGYLLDQKPDRYDLAVPICRDGIRPEAALIISAPSFRWNTQEFLKTYLKPLQDMAARLSYLLGATVYNPFHSPENNTLWSTATLKDEEISTFLQGPWSARLACIRPDGRPHVVPVWQEWDGKHFYIIAWQGSQWAEYLSKNPVVSLTIDEPWPPLRRIAADGMAFPLSAKDSPVDLNKLLQRMARRYLGQASEGLSSQVQLAYRITPDRLRGWQGLPGPMIV